MSGLTGEILFEMFKAFFEEAKASLTQKRWVGGIPLLFLSLLWERFPPTLWPQLVRASLRQDFLLGFRYASNVLFQDSIGSWSTKYPSRHIAALKIQHIADCSVQQRKPNGFYGLRAKLCQVNNAECGQSYVNVLVMSVTLA